MSYTRNKRDTNEPELIELLCAIGADVHPLPAGAGRDLDVFFRRQLWVVEIKSSKNEPLTPKEKEFQAMCERNEVPYVIAFGEDSLLNALGVT